MNRKEENARDHALGVKRCPKCNEVKPEKEFDKATRNRYGLSYQCSVCRQKQNNTPEAKAKLRVLMRGLGCQYSAAVCTARARNREFSLTKEQFAEIRSMPCAYCGRSTSETGSGLDRIDNALGYTPGNVVRCCVLCNRTRSDLYTFEEMRDYIAPAIRLVLAKRGGVL